MDLPWSRQGPHPNKQRERLALPLQKSGYGDDLSQPLQDNPTTAKRPSYSLLDCTASRKALDLPPTHWRQTLRQLLEAVA